MKAHKCDLDHGYNRYTHGCHCEVCTEAKRERQKAYRAEKKRRLTWQQTFGSGGRHFVAGIKHGYAGYVESFCRCDVCTAARHDQQRTEYARRKKARLSDARQVPNHAAPALASELSPGG